jgi:hypothetical protein
VEVEEKGSGASWIKYGEFERFSNSYTLTGLVKGGLFSRKRPLEGNGFGVQQLENRYSPRCAGLAS